MVGTTTQIAETVWQYREELSVFRQVIATDLVLILQLLDMFKDMYFRGLCDRHTGFIGITYIQIITHLYTNYGIINTVDII